VIVAELPEPIAIPVQYVGADETPIMFVNVFLVQVNQDEIILSIGQTAPPILVGSPEEALAQARKIRAHPIRITARYGMTPTRARELAGLLAGQVDLYEKQKRQEQE
jgi:hypothetical protein